MFVCVNGLKIPLIQCWWLLSATNSFMLLAVRLKQTIFSISIVCV